MLLKTENIMSAGAMKQQRVSEEQCFWINKGTLDGSVQRITAFVFALMAEHTLT